MYACSCNDCNVEHIWKSVYHISYNIQICIFLYKDTDNTIFSKNRNRIGQKRLFCIKMCCKPYKRNAEYYTKSIVFAGII